MAGKRNATHDTVWSASLTAGAVMTETGVILSYGVGRALLLTGVAFLFGCWVNA